MDRMVTINGSQLNLATAFVILVAITAMPMSSVATQEHASNLIPEAMHNFWLSPLTFQVFFFECAMGDTLEGHVTVTIDGDQFMYDQKKYDLWVGWGDGIDLYIFDNQSYEAWVQGISATPLFTERDLTELSWRINLPHTGIWYVVYDNDSSVYGKQVEGTIIHSTQAFTIVIVFLIIATGAIVLVISISLYKRR